MTSREELKERQQETAYRDVSPLDSEDDSDLDNDPVVRNARNSTEVANHDREVLEEEEERENLLATNGKATNGKATQSNGFFPGRRKVETSQAAKRRRKKGAVDVKDEEGKLMYEMEEGGPVSDVSSQASRSSVELDKFNLEKRPSSKRRRIAHCTIIALSILVLFIVLILGAYRASRDSGVPPNAALLSNGTSNFAPTTILISLDGFRADFLQRGITPTLNRFISEGVSPRWMLPSFPSVTFPNHYTLVTGLYPESHGIVGNTFWDPDIQEEFDYGNSNKSMQPKWWNQGEPVWVTAEKQGVRAAIHMWPGSEAGMAYGATFLDKFNGTEVLSRKTQRILEWLDRASSQDDKVSDDHSINGAAASKRENGDDDAAPRPQLIQVYVPNVDSNGHKYGPNSTEVWDTIAEVDAMLHNIFKGLDERNLTEIVNVVVVSDHGMATTSTDRTIQLDDLIDMNLIAHTDGWPHFGLRPKDPMDIRGLYDRLSVEAERSPNFDVYLRDENMPDRYHFSNNDRIAPLWVVPKTGWAIVQKHEFNVKEAKANGQDYSPKGLHGYDHEDPLMRAIFVARGPAFPHKPNSRVEVFQNTEVYNIICDSIGIEPKPNNGTLRLPLKPIGLHSDQPAATDDSNKVVDDTKSTAGFNQSHTDSIPVSSDTADEETPESSEPESAEALDDFWSYMKAKMKAAMDWAHGVVQGWGGSSDGEAEDGS